MSNWRFEPIGKLAETYSGGTPSRAKDEYFKGDIPWISSGEVNLPYIIDTKEKITQEALDNSSARWIPKNSVLVAMYGATAGVVSKLLIEATSNQAVLALLPNKELIDVDFLYYQVKENKQSILYLAQGSGQPNLSKDLIDKFEIKVPFSVTEQQKIAKILSTVDNVIEKTQTTIAKYKAIKQGMLNDLFTRGIDIKTGKLRPRQEDAPELYKESKLGMIPKDWDDEKLGCIGEFKNGVNKDKFSFGHGTLFVNIGDAYHEILDCSTLDRVLVSYTEKQQYSLINGDIIFVRSSVKPDGVGYNTIFLEFNDDVVFCGFMIRFRLNDKTKYNPEFYNSYFRYIEFRRRLLCVSTVSANTNVNQVALSNLFAIKPHEKEQLEIAKRLRIINNKIHTEENYLRKLQQIKSGLMADLLSGKKLVSIPNELETENSN